MDPNPIMTSITKAVVGEKILIRGYELDDLSENTTYLEETIFLLLRGRLPSQDEINILIKTLSEYRKNIPQQVKDYLETIPLTSVTAASTLM